MHAFILSKIIITFWVIFEISTFYIKIMGDVNNLSKLNYYLLSAFRYEFIHAYYSSFIEHRLTFFVI